MESSIKKESKERKIYVNLEASEVTILPYPRENLSTYETPTKGFSSIINLNRVPKRSYPPHRFYE